MKLLDLITRGLGLADSQTPKLVGVLNQVAESDSDLAPFAAEMKNKLESELAAVDLNKVGLAVFSELGNVVRGKLDPRDHPSDLA